MTTVTKCIWGTARFLAIALLVGCPRPVQHADGQRGPAARAATTVSMHFAASEDLVLDAMKRTLVHEGFTLGDSTPHRVQAERGSEATLRLLGALMTSDHALPTAILIDSNSASGDTQATVTVSDDFGFGSRAGLRGRYADLAEQIFGELRRGVEAAGGGPDRSSPPRPVATVPIPTPSAPSTSTAAPSSTAMERLQRLNDLHQQGLVTDKEYSEKRRAIIDGL